MRSRGFLRGCPEVQSRACRLRGAGAETQAGLSSIISERGGDCLRPGRKRREGHMRYKQLGRTGLFVSEITLGTMTFGDSGGDWSKIAGLQQKQVDELVRHALDAGINLIDTADVYSGGQSETLLGQSLRNLGVKRSDVLVATKGYILVGTGPNDRGASRA